MAFINVNKVTLESTSDVREAIGDVMLLYASLVYDNIKAKEYSGALNNLEMLKCSIMQLEWVLKMND